MVEVKLKTFSEITIILAASIGLSLLTNWVSPFGIPLIGQWDTSKGTIRAKEDTPHGKSVFEIDNVDAAKKIYDKGETLFVDARADAFYIKGHVKEAISLPVGDFDNRIDKFLNQHSLDQPIITYCSGRTCDDSHRLAQMLMEFGYENVSVMIDGFPGWEAGGYPVE